MRPTSQPGRYAERVLDGFDEAGAPERVVLWIERKDGGIWAVGRAVNPQHRQSAEPRADDFLCETYELDDALEQANAVLGADLDVSQQDGRPAEVAAFEREECIRPLERWFFGR